MKFRAVFLSAVMMAVFSSPGLWAQAVSPQSGHGMAQQDPAARLDVVLQSSGAERLTDAQRQQLTTLVNDFKTAHQNLTPDNDIQNARRDLEAAILAGNEGAVDSAAAVISSGISRGAARMIGDIARFEIQALRILTPNQVNALKNQYGNSGLIHTVGSLVGMHGRMHGGMTGPGMGCGMGGCGGSGMNPGPRK